MRNLLFAGLFSRVDQAIVGKVGAEPNKTLMGTSALQLEAGVPRPPMKSSFRRCAWLLAALIVLPLAVARAHDRIYTASLTGPEESPANASPGTGQVTVTIDLDLFTMRVEAKFGDLEGTVTAAHIHAPTAAPLAGTAGVATQTPSFQGFPLGVTSGSYDHTFDLTLASSYNPDFIAAHGGTISTASNALFAALEEGKAYFNIHTTVFPGGEIRGFLLLPPTRITAFAIIGGVPTISFSSIDERLYRVEREDNLNEATWTPVTKAESVDGTGDIVTVTDPDPGAASRPRRFYRVVLLP